MEKSLIEMYFDQIAKVASDYKRINLSEAGYKDSLESIVAIANEALEREYYWSKD